jgi:hypothetical protein
VAALAEIVFLTPRAALVGLAFLAPLGMVALRRRPERRVRAVLGLAPPARAARAARPFGLLALAALVAASAAHPALRTTSSTPVRSDAELILTFDVSRSMLATSAPGKVVRLERERALGRAVQAGLPGLPTGVATLTNRMMPLVFPTADARTVRAVIDHSLRIMQPRPVVYTTARESSLATLSLAADRTYFDPGARKRLLVVFGDLDSDYFSLTGTLRLLRRHRIEPFLVRVARPGERVFTASGRPYAYVPASTVTVAALRRAGWHAYEESEGRRLVSELRAALGSGPVRASDVVESQRDLAPLLALAALVLASALAFPALRAGVLARA